MIIGKLICEICGRDVTNGLWGFILGSRGTLNAKQTQQLDEFKEEFGKDRMVFCWSCIAKTLGAKPAKMPVEKKPTPPEPKPDWELQEATGKTPKK